MEKSENKRNVVFTSSPKTKPEEMERSGVIFERVGKNGGRTRIIDPYPNLDERRER